MYRHPFPVKLGSVIVSLNLRGLVKQIEWSWSPEDADEDDGQLSLAPPIIPTLTKAFQDYFAMGAPMGSIPWDLIDDSAWTPFQKQVYRAIEEIPHGETRTYGWVASRIRNANSGRAVGQALRANPLPILIPCHRVIASNSLGGFMGLVDPACSELRLKQRLIALEEEFINPLFGFLTPSRELAEPISAPPSVSNSAVPTVEIAPSLEELLPVSLSETSVVVEALA